MKDKKAKEKERGLKTYKNVKFETKLYQKLKKRHAIFLMKTTTSLVTFYGPPRKVDGGEGSLAIYIYIYIRIQGRRENLISEQCNK